MRILQIHNYYQTYGGECHVVDAEKPLLEARGHEVLRYTANSNELNQWGAGRKVVALSGVPFNRRVYRELAGYLQHTRPDVAHVHNVFPLLSPSVYVALRDAAVPVVQTVHNFRFLCPNGLFFINGRICEACQQRGYMAAVKNKCMKGSRVISTLYAAAVKYAWSSGNIPGNIDCFVALNEFSASRLVAGGVPREKIAICGNFIARFAPQPEPKRHNYVLYLGRLSPEKGIWTLLEALGKAPALNLKIAGAGPDEAALRSYVNDHLPGRVEFLGYVKGHEKERLVSEALCTVTPSEWYENFPISVVESFALGTPVIASRIGGLPEMVEHGKTGFLFDPADAAALAGCLEIIRDDAALVRNMSRACLETARARFGPDRHGRELVDIYNNVISTCSSNNGTLSDKE
jgi:glycosyltransferase involved in cell wall biosynthesis